MVVREFGGSSVDDVELPVPQKSAHQLLDVFEAVVKLFRNGIEEVCVLAVRQTRFGDLRSHIRAPNEVTLKVEFYPDVVLERLEWSQ